jgi:hypothetical protein
LSGLCRSSRGGAIIALRVPPVRRLGGETGAERRYSATVPLRHLPFWYTPLMVAPAWASTRGTPCQNWRADVSAGLTAFGCPEPQDRSRRRDRAPRAGCGTAPDARPSLRSVSRVRAAGSSLSRSASEAEIHFKIRRVQEDRIRDSGYTVSCAFAHGDGCEQVWDAVRASSRISKFFSDCDHCCLVCFRVRR